MNDRSHTPVIQLVQQHSAASHRTDVQHAQQRRQDRRPHAWYRFLFLLVLAGILGAILGACRRNDVVQYAVLLSPKLTTDSIDTKLYTVQHQSNTSLTLQSEDDAAEVLQRTRDEVLLYTDKEKALQSLNNLLPYYYSTLQMEAGTILRSAPSLRAQQILQIAANERGVILAPLQQAPEDYKNISSQPVSSLYWVKIRIRRGNTYYDGWVLVTKDTKLEHSTINPNSAHAILATVREARFWKSENDIRELKSGVTTDPYNDETHGLLLETEHLDLPHFILREGTLEMPLPFSALWPIDKHRWIIPTFHLEIQLQNPEQIVIRSYYGSTPQTYYPIDAAEARSLSFLNKEHKNLIYEFLTSNNTWFSSLHGKINITPANQEHRLILEWNIPDLLREQYEISEEKIFRSFISLDFLRGTFTSEYDESIIALFLPSTPHYIFFALTKLSENSFSLQHTIPYSDSSVQDIPASGVNSTPKGPKMVFTALR